ncbi:MAG: hypothetical protein DDT34_01218 [Firmicutes bacterium]|nr:hypothetical protein [Bacillota bacterium]
MQSVVQGLVLGVIIILPGMSGGTVFLMMGLYENLVADLVRLRLKRYLPLLAGMLVGIFVSGVIFARVFMLYRDRSVLATCPTLSWKRVLCLCVGLVAGLLLGVEPLDIRQATGAISPIMLIVGGALGTAAMVLPGVPGSSVLIIMGIYDSLLYALSVLAVVPLLWFLVGSVMGLFLLAHVLDRLYARYHDLISYFFAGLIVGSSRALLPNTYSYVLVPFFLLGFALVWWWSGRRGQTTAGGETT